MNQEDEIAADIAQFSSDFQRKCNSVLNKNPGEFSKKMKLTIRDWSDCGKGIAGILLSHSEADEEQENACVKTVLESASAIESRHRLLIKKTRNPTLYNEVFPKDSFIFSKEPSGIFKITLNETLPDIYMPQKNLIRKRSRLKEMYKESVRNLVNHEKYEKCYMVFVHICSRKKKEHDVDNYDEKLLSDLIAKTFLSSGDSIENCRRISIGCYGSTEKTEIYLVPFSKITTFFHSKFSEELSTK